MGAIDRNGYRFEVEFSQIAKKAAIHVTRKGEFIEELTMPFEGNAPTQEQIEQKIGEFLEISTTGTTGTCQ